MTNPPVANPSFPPFSSGGSRRFFSPIDFLAEAFDISRSAAIYSLVITVLVLLGAGYYMYQSAPPNKLTITCGPKGSSYYKYATAYAEALEKEGVKVMILPSQGSRQNLQRLCDPKSAVDVGFVQDVPSDEVNLSSVVSLGSIAYQPLFVFYRGSNINCLSDLAGKKISIGSEGSGTRALSLSLLKANDIVPDGSTTLLDWNPEDSVKGLHDGTVDAVFMMSEDAVTKTLHDLVRDPQVKLLSFSQAEAYTRRFPWLSLLKLPQGSIELGKKIPLQDVYLVGPTVELVARKSFHPALSDLLLEAARDIHGKPSILQREGEFPAPIQHLIPLSPDAQRFYKSGKTYFYRTLPFWLAILADRFMVVIIPSLLLLYPCLHYIPQVFDWRIRSQIHLYYRSLSVLEKEFIDGAKNVDFSTLLRRLDQIEAGVKKLKVPAAFVEQLYVLRGHIDFVRQMIKTQAR